MRGRPWIPRSFDLMHRSISVLVAPTLEIEEGSVGSARSGENRVLLDRAMMKVYAKDERASVFWHEVWHHIMSVLNEEDLQKNEKLADQFGGLMAQMMKTADWRPPEDAR